MQRLKLVDRMAQGKLSRREFNRALGIFGLTAVTMPFGTRRAQAGNLVYFTWSGYEDPRLFPGYDEKRGAPDVSFFEDEYEAIIKLEAGYKVDIVAPCIDVMPRWFDSGLLPIDESRLLYFDDMFDSMRTLENTFYDGKRYFVPTNWGTSSICYRPDLVDIKPEEESFKLLFDERFKGRISMWDSTDAVIPAASLALGYLDHPFLTTGDQLKKVGEILRKERPLLRFYWSSTTELLQALATGEVAVAFCWDETAVQLKREGVPIVYAHPKEGRMGWICGLGLRDGDADEDAVYDFLNASMTAEAGKFYIEEFGYGSQNRKAYDLVAPELLEELGQTDPENTLANTHKAEFVPPEIKQQHFELFDDVKAGA